MRVRSGLIPALLLAAFFCGSVSTAHADDGQARLHAVMILASNEPAPQDARLKGIESKLRGVFGFKYYSHYGEGSASVALPGSATIELGKGYSLHVKAGKDQDSGKIRLQVSWRKGNKPMMDTSALVSPGGGDAILGGPSHGEGKLLVLLSVR